MDSIKKGKSNVYCVIYEIDSVVLCNFSNLLIYRNKENHA